MDRLSRLVPHDLRAAARALATRPGYAFLATFTLALGIGGSVLVFSIVDAVAFAEMPYVGADNLAALYERSLVDPDIDRWPVSRANYLDWRATVTGFDALEAYEYASPLMSTASTALRPRGIRVTGGLFDVLGVRPTLGRGIDMADVKDAAAVVVISDGLWTRAFGRDADIVGREVTMDRELTRIVGVMPPEFQFPFASSIEVWRPLTITPEQAADRSSPDLFVVGRLTSGQELAGARDELDGVAAALRTEYPETNEDRGVTIVSMREDWLEWRRPALLIFAVAAALALTIGCINLAGLMLSRGLGRFDELSVRKALGASRGRVAAVVLGEGFLIATAGILAGGVLATAMLPVLLRVAPSGWGGTLLAGAAINLRAFMVAAAVGGGTVLVASLAPIMAAWQTDPIGAMRAGARSVGGRRQLVVRRGLVVVQTILAVFLLAQAGLLTRSMVRTYTYDVGFDYQNVLTARVLTDIDGPDNRLSFYRTLANELDALPGVRQAWLSTIPPLTGFGDPVTVTTDGSAPGAMTADAYNREIQYRGVDPDYFEHLDVPVVRGSLFDDSSVEGGERVGVVNQRFVEEVLAGKEAIGAAIRASLSFGGGLDGFDDPIRIVGVVGDTAEWGLWSQPPMVFVPTAQARKEGLMHVMLKTDVPPETLIEPLRATVWDLGNRLPLEEVAALADHHRELYGMHDFMLFIVTAFAGFAIVLAAVGLYGVIALQVAGRRRELSVRMALGATARSVLRKVLKEGLGLSILGSALAGLLVAALAPWVGASWMSNFLHGIHAFDPVSLAAASGLLVVTAAGASLMPARQASQVDPASALRGDT
ncbi:MAG: FtsX-like permease family protein [Acidobacteria bacterium]|nr:FtsX-like permease family protein [Acidobacteriota bacterium]